jgi:hypothetical protein
MDDPVNEHEPEHMDIYRWREAERVEKTGLDEKVYDHTHHLFPKSFEPAALAVVHDPFASLFVRSDALEHLARVALPLCAELSRVVDPKGAVHMPHGPKAECGEQFLQITSLYVLGAFGDKKLGMFLIKERHADTHHVTAVASPHVQTEKEQEACMRAAPLFKVARQVERLLRHSRHCHIVR